MFTLKPKLSRIYNVPYTVFLIALLKIIWSYLLNLCFWCENYFFSIWKNVVRLILYESALDSKEVRYFSAKLVWIIMGCCCRSTKASRWRSCGMRTWLAGRGRRADWPSQQADSSVPPSSSSLPPATFSDPPPAVQVRVRPAGVQ
jgi:hypothetical protein